jgi:hypothetical protein
VTFSQSRTFDPALEPVEFVVNSYFTQLPPELYQMVMDTAKPLVEKYAPFAKALQLSVVGHYNGMVKVEGWSNDFCSVSVQIMEYL